MSRVVVNPPPKIRFQETRGNVSEHRELLQKVEFGRALDWALLQYQYDLCRADLPINESGGNFLKLKGAHEFVRTLYHLAESPVASVTNDIMNLDHSANT